VLDFRPVQKVELGLFPQRFYLVVAERIDAEGIIEGFQDFQPMGCRLVIDGQVFPDGIEGQQRAEATRQHIEQDLQRGKIADTCQIPDVFPDQPLLPLGSPAPEKPDILLHERFRKSAESPEEIMDRGDRGAGAGQGDFLAGDQWVFTLQEFGDGKGMQPVIVVSAHERVPAAPVNIETGAAGDEHPVGLPFLVEEPLEVILPVLVFVNLIEEQDLGVALKAILKNVLAVGGIVPIQILVRRKIVFPDETGQPGLSHLPGTADEDHFVIDI